MIVNFIDQHQGHRLEGALRWGGEQICAQLAELGAPSTYYEHRNRPPTAHEVPDAELKLKVTAAFAENYGVYGARKV